MGAWDVSVFGNDDAADYSYEFDDAGSLAEISAILERAMDVVLQESDEIDAADGAVGLAAAALVIAWDQPELLGDDAAYAPEPWPKVSGTLDAAIGAKAKSVFKRMQSVQDNEWAELWDESQQIEQYLAEIQRWESVLR